MVNPLPASRQFRVLTGTMRRLLPKRTECDARSARARLAVVLAPVLLVHAGCSRDPDVVDRVLTVHTPSACAIPSDGYGYYYAAGDFQPTAVAPASEGHFLRDVGIALSALPASSKQLVVDVSTSDDRFLGFALMPDQGPIDVVAWPTGRPCSFTGAVGDASRSGAQLTVSGSYAVVTGGGESGRVPESFVADLRTGRVTGVSADLLVARQRTATAPVEGGIVVAGGVSPDGLFIDNAEHLSLGPSSGFDRTTMALSGPRADHAALEMASGEVLLVGGTNAKGAVLASLEAIDAVAGRARTAGLASLEKPRKNALALRLANGEILIAGGADTAGASVATLEWISADATHAARAGRDLPAGSMPGAPALETAIALAAGGALVVSAGGDGSSGASVTFVTPDGDLTSASPIGGSVTHPILFAAAGGSPVLWTGDRWLRWQPWSGGFAALGVTASGPPASLGSGATGRGAIATPADDPGLLLWLDGARLAGFRVDVRGPYTTEAAPLLLDDPGGLVADRLVAPALASGASAPRFDSSIGLSLPQGTAVFLTDETFSLFTATLTLRDGPPPRLVLRREAGSETWVGDRDCPLPSATTITVTRRGPRVMVSAPGQAARACAFEAIGSERLTLGLRAVDPGTSVVRSVTFDRN